MKNEKKNEKKTKAWQKINIWTRLNVDKYKGNIQKNLSQLRDGIKVLEQQLSEEEQTGAR